MEFINEIDDISKGSVTELNTKIVTIPMHAIRST